MPIKVPGGGVAPRNEAEPCMFRLHGDCHDCY